MLVGSVDLSKLFLQLIVSHLNKAEALSCSYATQRADNAVEMTNKHSPKGSTNNVLLFVECLLLRDCCLDC